MKMIKYCNPFKYNFERDDIVHNKINDISSTAFYILKYI